MAFKLTSSAILLVLANMIPLFGIFVFGWDAVTILVLYWLESVIIGGLNVVKILSVRDLDTPSSLFLLGNIFYACFFIIHFGMFTWGHGEFLKGMFGAEPLLLGITEGGPIMWTALSFLISHIFSMIINFFGKKEYLGRTPNAQMMQPYGRVFVMHLVVLFGGFFVQNFGAPVLAVVLLIILKTGIDLAAHSKDHKTNETIAL